MLIRFALPWPPKELSPNARLHWARLARAKKSYRSVCALRAREQGVQRVQAERLHVSLTFCASSKRAYDLDNALARMKAGLDGLADVLGVDDRHWSLGIRRGPIVKGGEVLVEVSDAGN